MHSPRVYFSDIGPICADSLRHGNGLYALLVSTKRWQNTLHGKRGLACIIWAAHYPPIGDLRLIDGPLNPMRIII